MIRISILYPNSDGSRFDFEYYARKHMPRSIELLSMHPGFRGVTVEKGLSGGAPGSAPAYSAMCHFLFESAEAFLAAFVPHAPELQGDMPNYTNTSPVVQINEILISR